MYVYIMCVYLKNGTELMESYYTMKKCSKTLIKRMLKNGNTGQDIRD